jgi:hypothetical protein
MIKNKSLKIVVLTLLILIGSAFFRFASAFQIRAVLRSEIPEAEITPPADTNNNDNSSTSSTPSRVRTIIRSQIPEKEILPDADNSDKIFLFSDSGADDLFSWDSVFEKVKVVDFDSSILFSENNNSLSKKNTDTEAILPIDGIDYRITREKIEVRDADDFTWFGKVEGSPYLSHFAVVNNRVAGEIWLPNGEHRSLLPRSEQTFLVEWNDEEISRGLIDDQILISSFISTNEPGGRTGPRIQRRLSSLVCPKGEEMIWEKPILFLYDSTALDWAGGDKDALSALAQTHADSINNVNLNSLMENYRVKVAAVHEFEYTSSGNLVADLQVLIDSGENEGGEVRSLMQKIGAVEASLMIGATNGRYYGMASGNILQPPGGRYHAGVIAGGSSRAFVHEDGHNNGCGHQVGYIPDSAARPFAHGWIKDEAGMDVMAAWSQELCPTGRCWYIPLLSTPHVLVSGGEIGLTGTPAGVAGEAECASILPEAYTAFGVLPMCK